MVVGNHHLHPHFLGMRHAVNAGDAIIDGDEEVWFATWGLRHQINNGGGEPVTQFETIRYKVIQLVRLYAQQTQAFHRNGTGRGAIRIIVRDNADFTVLDNGVCQQARSSFHPFERCRGEQIFHACADLISSVDPTGGIQSGQKWADTALFQLPGGPFRPGALAQRDHVATRRFRSGFWRVLPNKRCSHEGRSPLWSACKRQR